MTSAWGRLAAVLACASLLTISAVAQAARPIGATRPDFSGRWTLDTEAMPAVGRGRGDMGSGWGSPMTIAQDAARLVVEYVFFARGDLQPPLKFVYALDGSETRNTVMMGRGTQVQLSRTTWDGDRLVITTTHTVVEPGSRTAVKFEVKQVLSLASPTSLIVDTTRAGVLGGPETSTRTVYRKI